MDHFVSPISIYFPYFFPKLWVLESVVMTTEEWTWLTSAAFVPSKWADLKFVKALLSRAAKILYLFLERSFFCKSLPAVYKGHSNSPSLP